MSQLGSVFIYEYSINIQQINGFVKKQQINRFRTLRNNQEAKRT